LFRLATDLTAHLRHGGTLVVPTRQRLRAVQLAYAAAELAAGRSVWGSPDVLTPAGFMRREAERLAALDPEPWPRVLTTAEEWLWWEQSAAQAASGQVFLDHGALAQSLQRASELAAAYHMRITAAAPGSEAGLLFEAQRVFEARVQALNATPVSALAGRLCAAAGAGRLLLRGFDAIPPQLAALAAARPTPAGAAPPAPPPATARLVRPADSSAELAAITAWCRTRLQAQPDARLLVMLPGAAGARERLAAFIRAELAPAGLLSGAPVSAVVGIEGGDPFAELPLPAHALTALSVLCEEELEFEGLASWLVAPHWETPSAAQRAALALMLRQRGLTNLNLRVLFGALQLAPPELKATARELDGRLHRAAAALGEGSASPRRWSERFERALELLGWPGALTEGSAAQQTRLRWRELLEEFGELSLSASLLRREAALPLLRSLAARTAYRPAEEDVSVSVSPMLADPVAYYDGIWVGALSAEVLPQPVSPDPFLPLGDQLASGVPAASAAGRRAQAQALLRAWQGATQELMFSVPVHEEDLEVLPSPLLSALEPQLSYPRSLWRPAQWRREGLTEEFRDERGQAWTSPAPLPGGTRVLTLQSACPFHAYAELRLGAAPPEHAEPGIAMDQRGRLLHAALQGLWERLRDSATLAALGEAALEQLIGECVAHAAQALQADPRGRRRRGRRAPDTQFDLFAVLSPALAREAARARRLIRRLCDLERTRPAFRVEATEAEAELALGGARIRMRLDRIDAIEAGRVILDYKSGRSGHPDWYGERPTHPQLLAYLAASGTDVAALATVNVNAREVRFTGVARASDLLPQVRQVRGTSGVAGDDWQHQQRAWLALIERLIGAFLAGDARVDPAAGACDYCHVMDVCRILEVRAAAHSSAGDDTDE